MNKVFLIAIMITMFSVWAAGSTVDFSSGNFECDNGYKGTNEVCKADSDRWVNEEACQNHVAYMCR